MHKYDLTDRKTLLASLPKDAVCAEIGVADGLLSQFIFNECEPDTLVLVDPWVCVTEGPYSTDPSNGPSQDYKDGQYESVKSRFSDPCSDEVHVLRMRSTEAAERFVGVVTFDWVYIDANHLEVEADIAAWWPLIRSGGWLIGHDYTTAGEFITVKQGVDDFVKRDGLELFIAGLDSEDVYERNYPTWMVEKP